MLEAALIAVVAENRIYASHRGRCACPRLQRAACLATGATETDFQVALKVWLG